jgi:D-amino-acid dehydrogenase
LLGEADYRDLVRQAGQLFVWEGKPGPTAEVEARLRSRAGVAGEVLGADDIRQLVPELSRDFAHGVLVPGNGHTANPARAVRTLGEKLRAEGGEILAERVMKLIPRAGGGFTVMTNVANHGATDVVVAGGAWSMQLLAPLGVKNIPLETERGYHAFLPEPSIAPRLPVCNKSRGFFITPMEHGLRVAGTVEFAGLDAAPDERRAEILLEHAKRMLPGLQGGKPSIWMGMRPSLPDSLPVLGPVKSRPGLWLAFGHGHFGITGGPPSGRLVASMITGQKPNIDPTPYSAERF